MVDRNPVTFSELWSRSVAADPTRPFLTFEAPDGTIADWTYGEFDDAVTRVARELFAHGVGPDRVVHLALTNTPSFVAVWLAALRLGSYIVPPDPMATATELEEHIGPTSPAVGFCAVSRAAVYRAAVAAVEVHEVHVVEVDEVPVAFVVPPAGRPERPHRCIVVDDFARTSVGKIRKFLLAEAATATPTVMEVTS